MKSRAIAFALLIGGAVLMLVTASLPWYEAGGVATFSGADSTGGLAQALALVVLPGVLLMLVLRRTGRRVVAGLVAVIGLAAAALLPWQRPSAGEVIAELRKQTLEDSYRLTATGAGIGYALAALLVVAGAVLVLLRAPHWPQRTARFERPSSTPPSDDPAAIWKAIDAGEDPTR